MSMLARLASCAHRIWQTRNLVSVCLYPFSLLTRAFVRIKKRRLRLGRLACFRSPCPVVVVGNIVVGGTGKTPVVVAITRHLQSQGWNPGIISRGYGVKIGKTARHGQGSVSAQWLGDEPSLLARATGAPVCVHPKRVLAARTLLAHYPKVDVLISDDGMQHLRLLRDVEIAVQDQRGIGNGWLLPAGPLRDEAGQLACVDWLITQLAPGHSAPATPQPNITGRSLNLQLRPTQLEFLHDGSQHGWQEWKKNKPAGRLAALAAIGQPQRFFAMLRQEGLELTATRALADHALLKPADFEGLNADYIFITRKDAVKYAASDDKRIVVVDVEAVFSRPEWLDELNAALSPLKALPSDISKQQPGVPHGNAFT